MEAVDSRLLLEITRATVRSNFAAVKDLLEKGANPDVADPYSGEVPVAHALKGWLHWDIVELLFNFGATPLSEEQMYWIPALAPEDNKDRYFTILRGVAIKGYA